LGEPGEEWFGRSFLELCAFFDVMLCMDVEGSEQADPQPHENNPTPTNQPHQPTPTNQHKHKHK
jgi:hypothetical protein